MLDLKLVNDSYWNYSNLFLIYTLSTLFGAKLKTVICSCKIKRNQFNGDHISFFED